MTDTDTLARHEAKTEPPKRWRNKWIALDGASPDTCPECGTLVSGYEAGALIIQPECACPAYPSKEVAEQVAEEFIDHDRALGLEPDTYLGAYPESAP